MGRWDIRYTLGPPDDDPQRKWFEKSSTMSLLMAVRKKRPKDFDDLKKMIERVDSRIATDELLSNYEEERKHLRQKKME